MSPLRSIGIGAKATNDAMMLGAIAGRDWEYVERSKRVDYSISAAEIERMARTSPHKPAAEWYGQAAVNVFIRNFIYGFRFAVGTERIK